MSLNFLGSGQAQIQFKVKRVLDMLGGHSYDLSPGLRYLRRLTNFHSDFSMEFSCGLGVIFEP